MNTTYSSHQLKELASKWILRNDPDAEIRREYKLTQYGWSKIDLAAFSRGALIGIEIKGHRDGQKRHYYENQLTNYHKACSPIYLLTCPSIYHDYATPDHWGRLRVERERVELESRAVFPMDQSNAFMLCALWREELKLLGAEFRVDLTGVSERAEQAAILSKELTLEDVIEALRRFTLQPRDQRLEWVRARSRKS